MFQRLAWHERRQRLTHYPVGQYLAVDKNAITVTDQ